MTKICLHNQCDCAWVAKYDRRDHSKSRLDLGDLKTDITKHKNQHLVSTHPKTSLDIYAGNKTTPQK